MIRRWWFPLAVFAVALFAVHGALALLNFFTRPADIPVAHGVSTSAEAGQGFDSVAVDAYAVEFLRQTKVRGLVLAIVRGDEVLHTAGYGYDVSGAPLTADSPMPLASLSKSMTAAAVMRLVEDGAIALDEPVQTYLPTLAPARATDAALTVRQLLNQSSGLADVSREAAPPQSAEALIARLNREPFRSEPGAVWAYNNANYILLAALIEQVSGEPFADHLRRRVFDPIGMDSSASYANTDDPEKPVGRGYRLLYGAPLPGLPPRGQLMLGAGGVASSANDLARWLVVQDTGGLTLEGARILASESVSAMQTPSGPSSEYGYGWRARTKNDGTTFVFHAGRNVVYAAYEAVFPETGFGYAIAWNTLHPFGAEQAMFYDGVYALISGAEPAPLLRFGFIADGVAATLTVLSFSIGVVGAIRARELVRANRRSWLLVLRTAPYVIATIAAALFPGLWFAASWAELTSVWPAFAIFLAATGLSAASVIAARLFWLFAPTDAVPATLEIRTPT